MAIVGKSIVVTGEVRSTEDLSINCRVDGPILCEGGTVTITESGVVNGDVVALDITVFGRSSGQLIAIEVVDIRPGAVVTGVAIAPKFILHDGANFAGRVDPQRLDAALSVVRFQRKQRDSKAV